MLNNDFKLIHVAIYVELVVQMFILLCLDLPLLYIV